MTRSSAVPGGTVERMTTTWVPGLSRSAAPIVAITSSTACRLTLPSGPLGVPTEMNDTSVSRTDPATSIVARRRPWATASAIRTSISSSTIGDWPRVNIATFSGETSTPTISCPALARHPQDTAPT